MINLTFYKGRLGNQLLQYAAAYTIAEKYNYQFRLPKIIIDNKVLPVPYTNIKENEVIPTTIRTHDFQHNIPEHIFDNPNICYNITGFFQKYRNVSENVRQILYEGFNKLGPINKSNNTIVHIRAGDQFLYNKPLNHQYVLGNQPVLPINYYKLLLKNETNPILFICENKNDKFIKELSKHFPNAEIQSTTILNDFLTILTAKKYIMSVSSYSWCAGWLLKNYTEIIMPINGFFHPNERERNEYSEFIYEKENMLYYDFYKWSKHNEWNGTLNEYKEIIKPEFKLEVEKISYQDLINKYNL